MRWSVRLLGAGPNKVMATDREISLHKKQEGKDGDKLHITRQTRVAVQFESNLIFKLISIKISGGYEMVGDISTTSDANAMGGGWGRSKIWSRENDGHYIANNVVCGNPRKG